MLISPKLLDMNNQIYNNNYERKEENKHIYKRLNPISKIRFNHLNKLIFELASTIERISGWTYTPSYFTLKTNYHYDYRTNEISYDTNRVEHTKLGYVINETSTEYEKQFITKYQELLKRLHNLEQKRERLISPYKEEYKSFIIDFNQALKQKKQKSDISNESDYLSIASNEFISKFGIDGIKRLIRLLNETVDNEDLLSLYNNQFDDSITSLYVDELFRWASSFSPRAQYTRDLVEKKRYEAQEVLTDDLRKKIR